MVSGYGEFDEQLMRVGEGKIVCKRGAEGYQIIGFLPGALSPDSPGVGIALKVSDGDASRCARTLPHSNRVRPCCGARDPASAWSAFLETGTGSGFVRTGETRQESPGIVTGQSRPVFEL